MMTLLLLAVAAAQDIPALTQYVNDRAGVLRPEDVQALTDTLAQLERTDSTQVVVLTVPTTGGQAIEEYSLAVARQNGIGRRGRNNGILITVAVEDRACRIEVGYGLEGKLPDTTAALIIKHEMIPYFKKGALSAGIRAGTDAVVKVVRGEYAADRWQQRETRRRRETGCGPAVLMLILIIFFGILGRRRRHGMFWLLPLAMSSGRRSWGGGGGFGGFGGFRGGGGSFGGGGASGRW